METERRISSSSPSSSFSSSPSSKRGNLLRINKENYMPEIKPNEIYTTEEAQTFLKISNSTIKRLLKRGIIKAHKVGGQYRIWGSEILELVSPNAEKKVYKTYRKIKEKTKKTIEKW